MWDTSFSTSHACVSLPLELLPADNRSKDKLKLYRPPHWSNDLFYVALAMIYILDLWSYIMFNMDLRGGSLLVYILSNTLAVTSSISTSHVFRMVLHFRMLGTIVQILIPFKQNSLRGSNTTAQFASTSILLYWPSTDKDTLALNYCSTDVYCSCFHQYLCSTLLQLVSSLEVFAVFKT